MQIQIPILFCSLPYFFDYDNKIKTIAIIILHKYSTVKQ